MPAETLLDRTRTDWFPEFLSHGQMTPHFQPIVELATGRAYGREALMRGKLGTVELRGGELMAAAEAHDALFSFDYRARTAALEVGLPLLPEGEILFVNLDPRAALDVERSLRTTWPVVGRLGADPSRICLELIKPERCAGPRPAARDGRRAPQARRARSRSTTSPAAPSRSPASSCCAPTSRKIDTRADRRHPALRRPAARSSPRSSSCAHEQGAKVVAEGVERVDEFRAMAELGVDLGQGFYFGQPTEKPMAVDPRLVAPQLVLSDQAAREVRSQRR